MGKTKSEQTSVKAFLEAIKNSGGIKENVARKLGISRHTVTRYQKKYPTIAQALLDEMDVILDKAEGNLFHAVQEGDLSMSQWLLRYKGKARGYADKVEAEITGEDGNPLKVQFEFVTPIKRKEKDGET